MKKNIILSVVCGVIAMANLTSCSDFLQVTASNQKEMYDADGRCTWE